MEILLILSLGEAVRLSILPMAALHHPPPRSYIKSWLARQGKKIVWASARISKSHVSSHSYVKVPLYIGTMFALFHSLGTFPVPIDDFMMSKIGSINCSLHSFNIFHLLHRSPLIYWYLNKL